MTTDCKNNVVSGFAACKLYLEVLPFDSHEKEVVSEETLRKTAEAKQLLRQPKNTTLTGCVFNHDPRIG